jgi:hypothetical protein
MALKSPEHKHWLNAVKDELDSIEKNNVWKIVTKPKNVNIISTRWVFVKKTDEHGNLVKYKARLVARGFQQIYGVDYNETFAPVVRFTSIRVILSIAVQRKMFIHQMDVKTAFLNGKIDEDIYIEIPDGINENPISKCCKLNRSLYGLKQSPLSWNIVLDEFLKSNNLNRTDADFGVYIKDEKDYKLIVTTYVDDLLIISENINEITSFKEKLSKRFEMTDLGELKYILGIEVEILPEMIKIHQRNYINELVTKFGLQDSKTVNTPMEVGLKLQKFQENDIETKQPYASLIGSLLYLSNCTRPDITYSVNRLSSFNAKPTELHWNCAKRILRYLKKTNDLGLTFTKSNNLNISGYSDADWASDLDTRRSTTGYLVTINSNPVSWNSKRQSTVATSTAESEYMAMYESIREVIWINKLVSNLMAEKYLLNIFCDNQSSIHIAKNPVMHQRTKHIDIKYHFIRECIYKMNIKLGYLESKLMTADILTKPLPFPQFTELRFKLLNDIELRGSIGNINTNH